MAWTPEPPLVATTIGKIDHFLDDIDGTTQNRSLKFFLSVLDAAGETMRVIEGNEVPHLTATQQTQLLSFMASRRTALPTDIHAMGLAQNPPQDWFPAGNIVGRCTWRFRDEDGTVNGRSLHARVIELDSQGGFVRRHQFNDQPHLSAAQTNAALAFLDTQRGKAIAEILV